MGKEQRDGRWSLAALVNEVNADAIQGAAVVMESGCVSTCAFQSKWSFQ